MPTNINRGNTARFVVQFLSSNNVVVSPSSAWVTISYNINGTSYSSTFDLSDSGGMWTGTWSTVGVDLGDADWSVASSATTNPAQTGIIRVIDP